MNNSILYKAFSFFCLVMSIPLFSGCNFFFGITTWSFNQQQTHAELASQLRSEGKFSEAIDQYKKHIEVRLADQSRPESENPYFYYILIGDTYLEDNQPKQAYDTYKIALEHHAEKSLLIDRFRKLAAWYKDQGNLEQAMIILKEYRELDTLIFDYDIDQLHRKMVEVEEQKINAN